MLNELGVLLGVSHKIKRNKNHIYQWLRGVCFVPIIPSNASRFNIPLFLLNKKIFLIGGMASVHRMRLPPPRWGSPFLTG